MRGIRKHIPQRTCVACRRVKAKRELVRLVCIPEGGVEVDSDVLKVGHHGSKTSSCKEFIEAVSPEIAVIQCGKDNSYGHPHPETLQTLEGIKVFRTDLDGDVKIISDGLNYQIK